MELNRYTVKYLMSFKFIKQNLIQIKCHSLAKSSAELTDEVLTMIYGSRQPAQTNLQRIVVKKVNFHTPLCFPLKNWAL